MSMALKASKSRAAQGYGGGISGSVLSGGFPGRGVTSSGGAGRVPFGGVVQRDFRGDPGLFGDIFGGLAKTVGGFIPGPVGGIVTKLGGAISGGGQQAVPMPPVPQIPTPGFGGAVQRFLPGGQTGYQPAGEAPKGYHLNKTDYFLKDGTFVPKGTKWVKNRRRNPLNPKAASRAISRLESAKKATKRINRVTIRKAACK